MILAKQPKLLIKRRHLPLLCRHFCTENKPPAPSPSPQQSPQDSKESSIIITQASDLLIKTPENEWTSSAQIKTLLFSSTSLSPQVFFQITRRFPSSSKAIAFFDFIHSHLPSEGNTPSLSYAYQAVFELAVRERVSSEKLRDLYKACKDQNIPLSINSAALLVRFFGKLGVYDQSLLVYNELDHEIRNTHIRNALIDALLRGECDHVRDAFNVLDEMLDRESKFPVNELTGDIVFYALLRRELVKKCVTDEEIVGLVSKFGEHGVFPNSVWLTQLITRFCRNRKIDEAWDVLHLLLKFDAPLEAASCNALLSALGKDGDFKRMNRLVVEMKENDIEPSAVTFGIIINRLCKLYRVDEALEVFEKMSGGKENDDICVEPDVVIYNTLIDGLCKVGRQEEGLGLMERMRLQKGCAPDSATYNCLIDGFCKSGNIEKGKELFDKMGEKGVMPTVVTLNTLIDGMCRHGRINSAVGFFKEMMKKGLRGNAVTHTTFINAFCNVNNIQEAVEWFNDMSRAGISADAVVYFTLVSGLCQAGRMNDASIIVTKLKEAGFCPDILCYNTLINGFCKKNMLDKAYEVLREMEEIGMKPNCVTYNNLISFLSKSGDFSAARRVLKKMVKEGLVPSVVTYGALIHAYCIHGHVDDAIKIFKELSSSSKVAPNTVIYNILIDSLCKNDQVELALSLMEEMKVKGVRPNTNTYNAMLKGLRKKNMLEKAFILMDKMTEHACNPDYISMEILTEWLSEVGQTEKLNKFVQGYTVSSPALA